MLDLDVQFALAMRDARRERRVSLDALSEAMSARGADRLTQVTLMRIEDGSRTASLGEAVHIASALGFSLPLAGPPRPS